MIAFTWTVPPEAVLAEGARRYGEKLQRAVERTAQIIAPRLEAYARTNASWTDRTGNARSGLISSVVVARDLVVIYLIHSVSYGIFLELARGGRYAVVWPAIEAVVPEVWRTLRGILV